MQRNDLAAWDKNPGDMIVARDHNCKNRLQIVPKRVEEHDGHYWNHLVLKDADMHKAYLPKRFHPKVSKW